MEIGTKTLIDLLWEGVEKWGDKEALISKRGGTWVSKSYREWAEISKNISLGLMALGAKIDDKITIMSNTREEWLLAHFGILGAGCASTAIYPSYLPKDIVYITNDCEATLAFVEDQTQLNKYLEIKDKIPNIKKVIIFDGDSDADWIISFQDLIKLGERYGEEHPEAFDEVRKKIGPDNVASIIYTSGTTGPPKGVMLTHDAWVFEAESIGGLHFIEDDYVQLLFLPLSHSFAQVLFLICLVKRCPVAFAESIDKVVDNMKEVRPHFMGAVPRIYEKIYTKITMGVEEAGGLKKKIFNWSLGVGREVSKLKQKKQNIPATLKLKFKIANKLVFHKIKEIFGGRLLFFISGGAPLSKDIAEFFHAADILILEGWGLTETSAGTCVNRLSNYKFGTVGPPLPGIEIKIADDGEILVRARSVMKGYYKKEAETREVLEPDGWFHTGDIGVIDEDGFLKITDRKKDIIVTAGGKNVAPQNIENRFKSLCPYCSQIMVYGDKRKYLVALITLNQENIQDYAKANGIQYSDYKELTQKKEIYNLIQTYIDKLNSELASYETIKYFKILDRDFSEEEGEITPTLKVKRKVITQKYKDILDSMYEEKFD